MNTYPKDGVMKLSGYRSYVCPHTAGIQSSERELRVFGVGVLAKVKVSNNIPACTMSTAQTDGAVAPGSSGCSVATPAGNSVRSALVFVSIAPLVRRRATAPRRA